jgi:hypothetical protein
MLNAGDANVEQVIAVFINSVIEGHCIGLGDA